MVGIFKSIKKMRPASRAARKLCEHLQGLGVEARMIEEEGNHIALTEQDIDIAKVSYHHVYGGEYEAGSSYYYVDYGLRWFKVEEKWGLFDNVWARMKIQTKGRIRRKVVDFK